MPAPANGVGDLWDVVLKASGRYRLLRDMIGVTVTSPPLESNRANQITRFYGLLIDCCFLRVIVEFSMI